jgi:hypothetical protein
MATSNSRNFSLTRNEIVKRAFNFINIYGPSDVVDSQDQDLALDMLNMMLKSWQGQIRHSWNRQSGTLFTAYQDAQYTLSLTGDHLTKSYVNTTIGSSGEALGQTILTVVSSTGMTAADNVGIQLDDGTRQWTTIVSVDSATQITITASLTAAAAAGNTIIAYTSKVDRPLEILTATWQNITATTETRIEQLNYEEYQYIVDKTTDGAPSCFMYDPQLAAGKFHLWPRPNNVNYIINVTFQESLEDMDAQSDSPDVPQEWEEALVINLAAKLAFPYGRYPEMDKIKMEAQEAKALALNYDNQNTSILLSPSSRSNSRVNY